MIKYLSVLVVAAISLALLVPFASATIVPDKSIAGVELGMTQDQVTAKLGQPTQTKQEGEENVDPGTDNIFIYSASGLRVSILENDRKVHAVSTTNSSEKTSRGIGVGSSYYSLKKKVAKLKCTTISKSRKECRIGRVVIGKKTTIFNLTKGHVQKVTVQVQFP